MQGCKKGIYAQPTRGGSKERERGKATEAGGHSLGTAPDYLRTYLGDFYAYLKLLVCIYTWKAIHRWIYIILAAAHGLLRAGRDLVEMEFGSRGHAANSHFTEA